MSDEATTRARGALAARIRRGEYVVDTHAVADALLRHWQRDGSLVRAGREGPVPADPSAGLSRARSR